MVRHRSRRHRQDVHRCRDGSCSLKDKRVKKIILTRPAVEAGETLGLPGDLKVPDLYLQPLYDALTDMLPYDKVADYLEKV